MVVGSLLALCLMVGFGLVVGARLAERQALVDARRYTEMLGSMFVDQDMALALLEGDRSAVAFLDGQFREHLSHETSLRRIKVWSTDGEVLFSDDQDEIGRTYPLSDHKREALETSSTVEEVSDLSDSEGRAERNLGAQLIEVYAPIPAAGGQRVLFETYLSYDRVLVQRDAVWRTLVGLALVGFVALAAVQLTIGLMNVRWLRRRQREVDEHARASAERDRRLLARNLHDGPIQDLVGTAYVVDGASSALDTGNLTQARHLLSAASGSLRESVRGLRAGIVELHPRSIHQVGFAQALDDLAQPLRTRGTVVDVELVPQDIDHQLAGEMVEVAHSCVKELLHNVLQHAEADHVRVTLARGPDTLMIRVQDDGCGLDTNDPGAEQGHLGLEALADIAMEYRGALELWSAPGAGTDVRMELAL